MKKRNAVAAIIVLFMCVAVYLNWSAREVQGDDVRLHGNFGESKLVTKDNEEIPKDEEKKDDTEEKNDEKKISGSVSEYFEEARMEKQKARDSAITTLKEAVGEKNLSQESRDRAAASIETLSSGAVSETRIETLVKAKGYDECVALINESGVNVIVSAPAAGLTAGDTTKIKDIVVSETNIQPSKIKIIEIK